MATRQTEKQRKDLAAWENFACAALTGILANCDAGLVIKDNIADAVTVADMMMKERELFIESQED